MVIDRSWLALVRHLVRHRWITLLSFSGIALGVAVVVAVDLANQTVRRSFEQSLQVLSGTASHRLIAGATGLDEKLYADLVRRHGVDRAAPVVESRALIGEENFILLGIDVFSERALRSFYQPAQRSGMLTMLTQPDSIMLTQGDARRLELGRGDEILMRVAGTERRVIVAGMISGPGSSALSGHLIADIATVQELSSRQGYIDRIDLVLGQGEAERLRKLLPPGTRLLQTDRHNRWQAGLGRSFHANLAAMSLLALLVGGFLIYNAMSFMVVQRRELLAMLRMLGLTRGQLLARILLEAALLGLAGGICGILLGIALAQGLTELVSDTVSELYHPVHTDGAAVQAAVLLRALLLGLAAALVAALVPAWEAANTRPRAASVRSIAEREMSAMMRRLLPVAVLLLLAGAALIGLSGRGIAAGFGGLFLLVTGCCLIIPLVVAGLAALATPMMGRLAGVTGRYAVRGISVNLSRTGTAIAALALAVATTIGMGVMVGSFRDAVDGWLRQSLQSDLYISIPDQAAARADTPLSAEVRRQLQSLQGIEAVSAGRRTAVETESGPVELLALEMAPGSYRSFSFLEDPVADLWPRYHRGELVLVSEPFSFRQRVGQGDMITLPTPAGDRPFLIGGVFRNYGSERGLMIMDRLVYASLWRDDDVSTLGIYIAADTPAAQVQGRIRGVLAQADPRARLRPNARIREHSMSVFERTFSVTRVIRYLVLVVACIGILSALMALQFERAREYAVLRAHGLTRGGLVGLSMLQSGLMGLLAGLIAIPLGMLLARMLLVVINTRSFGWTIPAQAVPEVYVEGLLLAVLTAVLAGLIPGIRLARVTPAQALREE